MSIERLHRKVKVEGRRNPSAFQSVSILIILTAGWGRPAAPSSLLSPNKIYADRGSRRTDFLTCATPTSPGPRVDTFLVEWPGGAQRDSASSGKAMPAVAGGRKSLPHVDVYLPVSINKTAAKPSLPSGTLPECRAGKRTRGLEAEMAETKYTSSGWKCGECGTVLNPDQVTFYERCTLCGGPAIGVDDIDWREKFNALAEESRVAMEQKIAIARLTRSAGAALAYFEHQYKMHDDDGTTQDWLMLEYIEPLREAIKGVVE